ncbi:MAG: MCP four helix bundle domain-containing protein [Desulfomonile tiedjei]|uniref:histidine kinase n=1 Tax=Desulfomonile tiedjei TaxID=2358 RepID=A0A9D6V2K6_9BACT|nr:MCP four helix bundle domain-containing protein [Desulfomonile tiedjei]
MWQGISLRTRILSILTLLVLVTVGGGGISIWYTYAMDRFFTALVESDIDALRTSQELENALVMQKGYVTYYSQDGDPEWLVQLDKYHESFEAWLKRARKWAVSNQERDILNRLESQYVRYAYHRDEVIRLYKEGKKDEGFKVQKGIRGQYIAIIELCHEFTRVLEARLTAARERIRDDAQLTTVLASAALVCVLVLGIVLAYVLLIQVLGPIRQLAVATDAKKGNGGVGDEVQALSLRFQDLIEDVDQTKSKLKWSREHLAQAEKWALVGKLAAGVAHSVRNPLTSVKMRLFSMERTLALAPSQKEDFEVISEEIRHIDTIVQNFLEFSRPPKLKMQKVSPSDAVDMAVQLLRYRLESYDVKVDVKREERLPEISADPDQLKEVFVNLMVNACEAMVDGGSIWVSEEVGSSEGVGPVVVIKMADKGPGVPESIQEKLFQPFFSTKEEGTGLGLSIATRIVEEHGGWLDLKSKEGEGATFIITLPITEAEPWAQS